MPSELPALFPPQARAVMKAMDLQRCPIIGTMGSGKTRVALEAWWAGRRNTTAVLCGTNAIPTWYHQAQQWLDIPPEQIAIAQGTAKQRALIWRHLSQHQLVISTYKSYVNDLAHIPKDLDLIADEYHKLMRTRTTTWQKVKSHHLHSVHVYPTTGTPMRRGPQDLFPALSLCDPKFFSSYWSFVRTWCIVDQNEFGTEILGPKNMENFKEHIYSGYCAVMPKKETDKYLPKKARYFVPIQPSKKQWSLIKDIEHDSKIELSDGRIKLTPNEMTKILRERQVLVSPKLLDPSFEYGAGIEALGEMIEELDSPRPVVFSDFADGVPIIAEYLQKKFPRRTVWTLVGGEQDLHRKVTGFNRSRDDIMIVSLQYAQSFEFPRSQVGFVLGFNWSRDENEQAEDRLRRAISEYQNIKFFYFQYENTIDGHMLNRVREKAHNVRLVTPGEMD